MMVNQTGDGVKRHIARSVVLDVNITEELIRHIIRNGENTVNGIRILTDPAIRERGQLTVIISQMPHIKTLSILGTHLTGHTRRLVAVVSPCFLIAKYFIILRIALSVNFLVQNSHFTNVSKLRPVVIKHGLTTPKTLNALLVSMIVTGDHNANHKTMLNKALSKVGMHIGSERHSASITERRRTGNGPGILNNLINTDRNTITTKILRALKTSIRGSNSKMGLESLNVAGTTTSTPFIKLLNLESSTKLIDGSNRDSIIKLSPEISRVTGNTIINGRIQIRITSIRKPIRTTERIPMNRTSMITSLKITITIRNINIVRIIKQILRNRLIHRYNRSIAKLGGLNRHVRAFLRRWETGCHIVPEFIGNIWLSAFGDIRDIIAGIHTGHGGIIHRNIQRISKVLRTEPLVHNKGIGTERKGGDRKTFHTSRDAHIICQGSDFPAIGGGSQLGDLILDLGDPSGFSVLTHKLFPVFPHQTIGNKEIISIKIDVIHDRG